MEMTRPAKVDKFTKVYPSGWQTIRGMADNSVAVKVYSFLAEHCDHLNALVVAMDVLADELGVSVRTIQRATKFLEERGHLVILKVGTANAYILDAKDIWKNYDQYKGMAAFDARTLASKKHNKDLKRRLTHFMGQGDLLD